ncbi:hypothetical protein PsorP6_001510 [Peronosclerospora sorghi]|uniref:Uncharacterized protein n=1 Tax=Peronosclerospora sorghi TaxID=230839 RepID=A0ACC0WX93_9STRA|nr:hypothetical protein PsorP6_001510 [Peronosclerospora sorghi]
MRFATLPYYRLAIRLPSASSYHLCEVVKHDFIHDGSVLGVSHRLDRNSAAVVTPPQTHANFPAVDARNLLDQMIFFAFFIPSGRTFCPAADSSSLASALFFGLAFFVFKSFHF